ncbi:MAG: hypothetical protein LC685_04610, partial [Actinobacteria bacterium]|nr:hypothetical protein [Actinomycetota bacterium]
PPFTATQAGTYKWRASYSGDANSLGVGPTACLDPSGAVTVNTPPPVAGPHWGHYQWGTESNPVRAFWLLDRTGDPAMHAALANWAAYWNDGRAKIDPALPFVGVATDDTYVGQCVHTGNAAYSLALACAGGLADLTFAAPAATPHIITSSAPSSPCARASTPTPCSPACATRWGTIIGLPDNPDTGSCMSSSPRAGASLWYTAADGVAARSLYDGHAD